MITKAILEAAIRRGFLIECKESNAGFQYGLGPLGMEVRRNLINEWMKTVQMNRVGFRCKSELSDDYSAVTQTVRHHINVLRHKPPFCISLNGQREENGSQSGFLLSNQGFKNVSKFHCYYICHAKQSRLNFDQLLRRRENWWTEITTHRAKFDYVPAPGNSDETAVRMLPYPAFTKVNPQSQAGKAVGQDETMCLDIIEEIPKMEIESESVHISAIRNTLLVEPAVLALLKEGVSDMENGDLGFRLQKHLAPYPIAMIHDATKTGKFSAADVDQLVSVMEEILQNLELRYLTVKCGPGESVEDRWKWLKASGILYSFVIDANVLETGVVRFRHSDLDVEIETALPQIRTELLHRLGKSR